MQNIAIIIPTLNEERFIDRCLNSVRKQTYPFAEMDIMVVDGGSIDHTKEIVQQWSCKYPNVRLLTNPGKIQSIAFNIGVAATKADIVIRLDAHALYEPEYIRLSVKHLQENPQYGAVGGICHILPSDNSAMATVIAIINHSRFGVGGAAFRVQAKASVVESVPFGAFRREMIEEVGGMREDLVRGEDNEYFSRIRKTGRLVYLDPAICSSYFARPTLGAHLRQMYNNGLSIGQLYYIDRQGIELRHMIPLLFVLGLVGGALLSPLWWAIAVLYTIGVGSYIVLAIMAAIIDGHKYTLEHQIMLIPTYLLTHVAYGLGTLCGLVRYYQTCK